jgi:hypothetical protein
VSHGIGIVISGEMKGTFVSQPIGIELAPNIVRWFNENELKVL